MANTKLGNKHTCFHCGRKFYDFGKPDVICPGCGADQKSGVPPEEEVESESEIFEDDLDGEEPKDGDVDEDAEDFADGDLDNLNELDEDLDDYEEEDEEY